MTKQWMTELAGKRVLIVGGNGFLGRNFVEQLGRVGASVRATGEGEHPAVDWLGRLDFAEMENAKRALEGQQIVIDCIGRLGAAASNLQPTVSLEQELRPQLNLMLAAAESECKPVLLLVSSRLVYGAPQYLPVDELHPLQPDSFYAVHKITAENYANVLARTHGLRTCIFRLANPYGPYQKLTAKSYGVINHFLQRAALGEAIEVYGRGMQMRDYIFVDDVVEAMLRCTQVSESTVEVVNLGSGIGLPLSDAAEIITRLAASPPVVYRPWPEEDLIVETGHYVSDITRLRQRIGCFNPVSFEHGAQLTMEHYRDSVISFAKPEAVAGRRYP
ncbi:MAG: NAD-dependent epimerase/dehydratase family protein [Edaphobacter sp.]